MNNRNPYFWPLTVCVVLMMLMISIAFIGDSQGVRCENEDDRRLGGL